VTEPATRFGTDPTTIELNSVLPFEWPYNVRPYGWLLAILASRQVWRAARECDLVYVTCPPFPAAMAAAAVARRHRLPTVVDFRDSWSLDPYVHGSRLKKLMHRRLFPRLERRLLAGIDRLVTNTPSMQRAYRERYPELADDCVLIPNGVDVPHLADPGTRTDDRSRFRLTYCGRLGHGGRVPRALVAALAQLADAGVHIGLRVIGTDGGCLLRLQEELQRKLPIEVVGVVSHDRAMAEMVDADALLLYQEQSTALVTPVAGKTYEYLFSGRPILGIAPEGDNLDLIRRYAHRCETVSSFDTDEITAALLSLHNDWQAGKLSERRADPEFLERYNSKRLAQTLAGLFDTVAKPTAGNAKTKRA
jgi:glycosyltransferase involved in cell wall biosynthesis